MVLKRETLNLNAALTMLVEKGFDRANAIKILSVIPYAPNCDGFYRDAVETVIDVFEGMGKINKGEQK